nr:hypothetical protein [Pseudomonadota bacterium]
QPEPRATIGQRPEAKEAAGWRETPEHMILRPRQSTIAGHESQTGQNANARFDLYFPQDAWHAKW